MGLRISEFKKNIIGFVNDDAVIGYINGIDDYGKLMIRISKIQDFNTKEIIIENPDLEAEYDYHRSHILVTFNGLRLALKKYKLEKENFRQFYDTKGRIKIEYASFCDFINITKEFSAIIRNYSHTKLDMTLGERIVDLGKMHISDKQMQIAELTGLKTQTKHIQERV
jgi:hypothetical protein